MTPDVFEFYLSRVLDWDLSPEEFAELEQHLTDSPEARARYMEYADLHTVLDLELQKISPQALGKSNVLDMDRIIRRQNRRTLKIAAFSAAAILLLGLVTMRLFFVSEKEPTLVFETSPGTQFALTHSGTAEAPEGFVLEKGSRLQLSQGTVELTFASGVKSIVMAPADLTLHDDDTLFLNKGTAWFQVPQQAVGFNVKTSELDIVDLGTEFGVFAHADEHDEVHVMKGKVQVTTTRLRKESTTLLAGGARRIDPIGRLTKIAPKATAFLTKLPESLPYLYWSFDTSDGFQVTGTHPAANDISITPVSSPQLSSGHHNTALSLTGLKQHLTTDWPGFSGARPRTVSFWMKIPTDGNYKTNPGIVGWGDRTQKNHKWKITIDNQGPSTPARVRLSWGNIWLTAKPVLSTNEWVHITATSTGKVGKKGYPEATLYINGEKQPTVYAKQIKNPLDHPIETSTSTRTSTPLLIGADLFPRLEDRNFFNGKIDELYIFDGHMTEGEVQKVFNR